MAGDGNTLGEYPLTEINGGWPEKGEDGGGFPATLSDPNSATGDDLPQREFGGPQAFSVELRNRHCPVAARIHCAISADQPQENTRGQCPICVKLFGFR